ncbi:Dolichol phosphate-mannose biosynthesis regulatory protein [Datura stramonium]|uniref:Dolichol phosphate-mannose biosynthesis regulatory protein n=1 Tax=Datura stramonium TaxID=4076 RepID=A0ABS8RKM2_DATST|nr:Dolichol phosphate-mannose biosynthesis regulatory protein [Datura stramonium]
MEASTLINLAGRPKVKRKRDKDEVIKRQTYWVASIKERVMTCSSCRVPGHNARLDRMSGEGTSKSGKLKDKNKSKGRKSTKRQRRLIDEEEVDEEPPRS